ncbi:hypothetical protein GC174_12625 [bacterium]|nr:hypothetical protein [bacterium]
MNNEKARFRFTLRKASYKELEDCLEKFYLAYPTEDDCMAALLEGIRTSQNGKQVSSPGSSVFSCKGCGREDVEKVNNGRAVKCSSCKKTAWLTAGTFFERIRTARPYLACIWFLSHGISISSETFHLLIGVAQSTAWDIGRKVSLVLEKELMTIDSVVPATEFSPAIRKRSLDTPARQSPKIDLIETGADADSPPFFCENSALFSTTSNVGDFESILFSYLSKEPAHVDEIARLSEVPVHKVLSAMTILELEGLVQRLPGERYVLTTSKSRPANFIELTPRVVTLIGVFIGFFDDVYIGISGRYLQSYLARAWVLALHQLWPVKRLISLISSFGPLKMSQIKARAPKNEIRLFVDLAPQLP